MGVKSVLSQRAATGKPSMTMAVAAKAAALQAAGKDVIGFAAGEPDFRTPEHICQAAKQAIDDGLHGYTPNAGMPTLREAVAERLLTDIGVTYEPGEILISPGAKFNLYLACQTLLDPGDEVILPTPYWVSYPEMIALAGATTVLLPSDEANGFQFTAADLAEKITDRTKLLILTSPSNPSGAVIPPAEIKKIGALMEEKGLWCLADEIYYRILYPGSSHKSIASVSDYCREHTILVNGCSKTYAMTGWRIGYSAAPALITKAMANIQSQSTSCACSIAQAAAIAALTGPQDCVDVMIKAFTARRDLIVERLNDIEGITCATPGGAFYVMPDVSGTFGNLEGVNSPMDFCNTAIEKVLVAPVPGEAFGADRHIRLSYACSREQIEEGCARLKTLIEG